MGSAYITKTKKTKTDLIIVLFNVFEQFFLKQLGGVSSIRELIDDID